MSTSSDMKRLLSSALAEVMDESLKEIGFFRKSGMSTYRRVADEAEHRIVFAIDGLSGPNGEKLAHIHPAIQVLMPKVTERALALTKGDQKLLASAPEIVLNQPIDFATPEGAHSRWMAGEQADFAKACEAIKAFLWQWTLPMLDSIRVPADLVRLYESDDSRVMKQRHWYVFIAAAYQCQGQPEKAASVISDRFGSPGVRSRYAVLFGS